MEIKIVKIKKPAEVNIIIGQSHFIKTVEDIHELMVTSVPNIKFGLAFCEASGFRLIRTSGTCRRMIRVSQNNAINIGAGHSFFLAMRESYPINILPGLKRIPEVASVFCATANQVEVVVCETELGRGILGVIDGESPLGVEKRTDIKQRQDFLRKIGYKA